MAPQVRNVAISLTALFSVAGGNSVSVNGDPCHPLVAGDEETTVGRVCAIVESGSIYFEVTTDESYRLEETHICNLPYVSPGELDSSSYTIEILEEDALEFVCGFDETEYLVAGHATTYATDRTSEKLTSYFEIPMSCGDVLLPGTPEFGVLTPPESVCETVYGYIQNNNYCFPNRLLNEQSQCSTCFQHMTKVAEVNGERYPEFHQWGWVLGGFDRTNKWYRMIGSPQRPYDGELWAHSHDCDNNLGEKVGSFQIDMRAKRRTAVVTLEAYDGWVFKETHVHLSNEMKNYMPHDDVLGKRSVLPRFYSNKHELINGGEGTEIDRFEIKSKGTAYFIIHAVACLKE